MAATTGRPMARATLTAALALGLAACRTDQPTKAAQGDGGAAASRTAQDKHGTVSEQRTRRAGVGHPGTIDKVALSPDGKAAITRDGVGGTRVWPRLDGSVEPVPLPVRGPPAFSIARAAKGWVAFCVDPSGGAKAFAVDDGGGVEKLGEFAPFRPLSEGHVLPGGKHILALYRDHTIRLLTTAGEELAVLEERKFRPVELRISADGKRGVALLESRDGGGTKIELQPLVISTEGKPAIARGGPPKLVTVATDPSPLTANMSPDGKQFAAVDKWTGSTWEVVLVDLRGDAPESRFAVQTQAHTTPGVGFSSPTTMMASANDGGVAWLIDSESKAQRARNAPPQDFSQQIRVQAVAGDTHIASYGSWLYVADATRRRHRFLGYRTLQAMSVAISPDGKRVATVYPQGPVLVEELGSGDGERFRLPNDPSVGVFKVRFADDDHVITVDGMGGVQLIEWRTGDVIAETGVSGGVRSVQVDTKRHLLLIDRNSTVNDSRVFEFDPKTGFSSVYIVPDASYRAGLLRKGPEKHASAVLWTLDGSNKLRYYTLDELRSDLSADEIRAKGTDLKPGQVAPLAIDRNGRSYGVRWNGTKMELFVDLGAHIRSKPIPDGSISELVPAEDGSAVLAVHNRTGGMAITLYDAEELNERWSFATGTFHSDLVWSPDGRYVGIAAQTGVSVRDARSGEAVHQRCGLDFEAVGTPPNTAFSTVNQRTMCEP